MMTKGCPIHPGCKSTILNVLMEKKIRRNTSQEDQLMLPFDNDDSIEHTDKLALSRSNTRDDLSSFELTSHGDYKKPELQDASRSEPLYIANEEEKVDRVDNWQSKWSLNSLLDHGMAFTESYNNEAEGIDSSVVKALHYNLERSSRTIDVLKKQIEERDESIQKMLIHVNMLEEWRDDLAIGSSTLAKEREKELNVVIGLMNEKYERLQKECETLNRKLLEQEQDTMLKDEQIRDLQVKVNELTLKEGVLERTIAELKSEKGIFANALQRLNESFKERQLNMEIIRDRDYQKQVASLMEKLDAEKKLVAAKEAELMNCVRILRRAEQECAKLVKETMNLKRSVQKKDEEIKWMTESMLELEKSAVENQQDTTSRIGAAKAMLEDLRREKVVLKSRTRELKQELIRSRGKASIHGTKEASKQPSEMKAAI